MLSVGTKQSWDILGFLCLKVMSDGHQSLVFGVFDHCQAATLGPAK